MKLYSVLLAGLLAVGGVARAEAPIRAVVLEFQDQTGQRSDALLGGAIAPGAIAEKGVFLIGKALANKEGFVLVDRRDLLAQMEKLRPMDGGATTPTKPSFIQAAQALRADVVLRGTLMSLSTGKQLVNQGGSQAEFTVLTTRVGLEALDAKDGTVIAASDGVAKQSFRQTAALATSLSEDDVLQLVEKALNDAAVPLEKRLAARTEAERNRPMVALSVKTDADPALIEVDGVLVGSSPLVSLQVYQGDHVLTIGKPGYQQVTKRILLEKDTEIEVPMLREQLTADELKQIYEKIELKVIQAEPGLIIHTIE
ncbi:MAG: PEGA domain-containing protein [Kiritimatiellae bacterium]|nr:PEGA domain-containing protein [Kiritimatiellia bacterium]MCO5062743.1 PEGA domain-containing protein [Kiritimatiellia bacterium]MCO5067088.1 PEGA domain-containing protein [Kiritimatiellia bacterium]MCO6400471.1 PEGA domain-containing protein [Verrucomicrobiota bacterium]